MRIFFIIDESSFFLPDYLNGVLKHLVHTDIIVGITPLKTSNKYPTIYQYIIRNLWRLNISQLIKLLFVTASIMIKKICYTASLSHEPMTIRQVAHKYKIPCIECSRVNSDEYMENLSNLNIDIIVSSCSQIFKEKLLALPHMYCINRHSALLPSYGGLFPVFQAMIHGEKKVGATVHRMIREIDGGDILAQKEVLISPSDSLFSLYEKSYKASIPATLSAISLIKGGTRQTKLVMTKKSYFSFPADEDWNVFFKKKLRFI